VQKAILYIIIGALIASGIWGFAYRNSNIEAQGAINTLRAERDEAIGRADSIELELGKAFKRIGELEEVNERIKEIIDGLSATSGSIGSGLREYGEINNDFRDFLEEYGA
jgi:hypothetical protein